VNAELAVRAWARSLPTVLGLVVSPDRVDFGYAGENPGTRIVLFRGGGAPEATVDLDTALIVFNCYGTSRAAAASLADALVAALRRPRRASELPLRSTTVEGGPTWSPDESGHPNYSVTALVTANMAAAAV
jgi:hypothetical protein